MAGESDVCPGCGRCGVVGAAASVPVLRLPGVPVSRRYVLPTRDLARCEARDVLVKRCQSCGLLWNAHFEANLACAAPVYEVCRSRVRDFERRLAADLVSRHRLHGREVVEVGCGNGEFLALLCELGGNRGLGMDPALDPWRTPVPGRGEAQFLAEAWDGSRKLEADLLVCRSMLERVPKPLSYLQRLVEGVELRPGGVLFVQAANARLSLREAAFWEFHGGRAAWFTPASLASLVREAGCIVESVEVGLADRRLLLEARAPGWATTGMEPAKLEGPAPAVDDLERRVRARIEALASRLPGSTALWGAGPETALLASRPELASKFSCAVSTGPQGHGGYLAGTGLPVVTPSSLAARNPSLVLVLDDHCLDDVALQAAELGVVAQVEGV